MLIPLSIVCLLILLAVAIVLVAVKGKAAAGNRSAQKCSRCKQIRPLRFYSNSRGTVMGLCKECKKELGEKEELFSI